MRLSFPKLTLLVSLVATVMVSASFAQSSGGRLIGKVVDKDGNPVSGVTVVVINQTTVESYSKTTRL